VKTGLRFSTRGLPAVETCFSLAVLAGVFVFLAAAIWSPSTAASKPVETRPAPEGTLRFLDVSGNERAIDLETLRTQCAEELVEVEDPYHHRRMRYAALPLLCVLDLGFAETGGAEGQRDRGLLLRALDGYTRPVSGSELLEPGGYLATGEPDRNGGETGRSRFTPIDRRGADPAPLYMVWTGEDQNDPHDQPWPYQLARIDVAPFEVAFPRTVPTGVEKEHRAWTGYSLFQASCASCHSINGQGGKVGPDLNVPRSIVEYRPIPQIRAYIRNPEATRYTSMPGHPQLSEADLDALIDYFSAMSKRKDDPRSRGDS
jgi:mono/diheme cytochrome c family protein